MKSTIARSQRSYAHLCELMVNHLDTPATAESTHIPISQDHARKIRDIASIDVHTQEEYVNIHAQYIATTAVESAFAEISEDQIEQEDDYEKIIMMRKKWKGLLI